MVELSHIRDNHPRNGYAKEYDESRAWCEAQKMQDCYIQSVDGLKLHGFYLPAEHAKRFVILSHGYRGSRFGSLSFMAKYLHEHQCIFCLWNSDVVEKVKEIYYLWSKGKMGCAALGNLCVREK